MSWSWNGNHANELAIAGAIAAAVLVLVWTVRAVVRRQLRNAKETATDIDDLAVDMARRTHLFLLLFPAVHLGARALQLPHELSAILSMAAQLSLVAQLALWVTGLIEFWLHRYQRRRVETDPASVMTINVFRIGMVVAVWIVAIVVMIDNLGYSVSTLLAGLGIGGVAVALATQNILSDLFASLSIVLDKPFVLGDSISIDAISGTIEHIGLKTTRIRSVSGEQIVISNSDLLKSRIHNFKRMVERRVIFTISVPYQTPAAKLERIPILARGAIEAQPGTRFDRAHFLSLGDSAYQFEVVYFTLSADYLVYADTRQAVNLAIVRQLEAEEIELAVKTTLPAK